MWIEAWGKPGIVRKIRDKQPCTAVDEKRVDSRGFLIANSGPVDSLLSGKHESNQPSNNHYN